MSLDSQPEAEQAPAKPKRVIALGLMCSLSLAWAASSKIGAGATGIGVVCAIIFGVLTTVMFGVLAVRTDPDSPAHSDPQNSSDAKSLAREFFIISIAAFWGFYIYSFHQGALKPPSLSLITGIYSSDPDFHQRMFGPEGILGSGIRDAVTKVLSQTPPDHLWIDRAWSALIWGLTTFLAGVAVVRLATRVSWTSSLFCGMCFSFAAYSTALFFNPLHTPIMTCELYRTGASQQATLSTDDMDFLTLKKCRLPSGFRMDRLERIN